MEIFTTRLLLARPSDKMPIHGVRALEVEEMMSILLT